MQALQIHTNGTGGTSGATTAAIAIPVDSSGVKAQTVLVSVEGSTYVLPGITGVEATNASTIVNAGAPLLLNVMGLTHIAHLQLTAAQRITVTPVEM